MASPVDNSQSRAVASEEAEHPPKRVSHSTSYSHKFLPTLMENWSTKNLYSSYFLSNWTVYQSTDHYSINKVQIKVQIKNKIAKANNSKWLTCDQKRTIDRKHAVPHPPLMPCMWFLLSINPNKKTSHPIRFSVVPDTWTSSQLTSSITSHPCDTWVLSKRRNFSTHSLL